MANTERLLVLRAVRRAKSAVNAARARKTIQPDEKARLDDLYVTLDKIEDELILADLGKRIDRLESACKGLVKVNGELKRTIKKLKSVAELVDKAAAAVKVLVDIVTKAATLVG